MIVRRIRSAQSYLGGAGLGPILVRALAGSGAVRIGSMAASFAVGVQLARMLGVEGYGYYGLAMSIITIAGVPGEMGVPRLVTREVSVALANNDEARLFGILRWARRVVVTLSVAMAFIAIGAAFVAKADHPSRLAVAILFGAPVIPLMAFARVQSGALQGFGDIVRGQIPTELVRPVLLASVLLAFNLTRSALSVNSAMLINTLAAGLALTISYLWLRPRLPARGKDKAIVSQRSWIASSISIAVNNAVFTVQTELLILIIGMFNGPTFVGLFRVATSTASIVNTPVMLINYVTIPVIARLHAQGEKKRLQTLVTRCAQAQFAGTVLLSLPILLFGTPLVVFFFGHAYSGSVVPLKILLVGQIISAAFGPTNVLLTMSSHERRVTRAVGVALVVNLVTLVALAPRFGLVGAALSVVAGQMTWNAMTALDARRLLSINTWIAVA